jgi:hypothetical protein
MALLSSLPFILLLATFVAAFFLKNFLVNLVLNSSWAEKETTGKGWAGVLNITSALHAILAFAILFVFFANFWWSVILAAIVGVIEYLFGWWEVHHRLPQVTSTKLLQAISLISTLKSFSYIGVLTSILQFGLKVTGKS